MAPLAVALGLVAAVPAVAAEKPVPKAHAAGGDVAPATIPSMVQTRVARTERALARAVDNIQAGEPADSPLKVVRRQMAAAWRGAKYIIRVTPPPPPAPDLRANAAAYAGPPETGVRVLTLQHDVAAELIQLIDGAHGTGLNPISTTLNFALDRRDAAIDDIYTMAPPAPPPPGDGLRARASGTGASASTFDALMPDVVLDLDDEVQAIEGEKSDAADLTTGGRRVLNTSETHITKTRRFVNTTWPPLPPGD